MSVILTNGATQVIMRDSDFQVIKVPPWKTPSRTIDNSVGLPRVHKLSGGREPKVLNVLVSLELSDRSATAQGMDSLMAFYEGTDYTGVDGDVKLWHLTDADGVGYCVKFSDDLAGGLLEGPVNQFNGTIQLVHYHLLPTDEPGLQGWWAAWDMENNGGDLSAWTDGEAVGDTGNEWDDKSGNGYDASQGSSSLRPTFESDTTNAINNRPVVNFDGTDDILAVTGVEAFLNGQNAFQGQQFSFYAVVEVDTFPSVTADAIFGLGRSATSSDRVNMLEVINPGGGSTADFQVFVDDGSATATQTSDTKGNSNPHIIAVIVDTAGDSVEMWMDGTKIINDLAFDVGTLDLDTARIGGSVNAGSQGFNFDGRIGELIVFSGSHTDLQRRRQEYRLSDLWDISLTG